MNNYLHLVLLLSVCLFQQSCQRYNENEGEVICHFNIETGDLSVVDSVVSVSLDGLTNAHDSMLCLYEIVADEKVPTPIQFGILDNERFIYWILSGQSLKNSTRKYKLVLENSKPKYFQAPISILNNNGGYEFISKGRKVLEYNTQVVQPPEGIDESYKRSGFINPLYAPNQTVLTRIPIASSDHLHHYGLWNAWKKVLLKGDTIDFFAPQFGQGTVRNVDVVSESEGQIFSSLRVLRDHVTWQGTEKETIAMSDLLEIKVYNKKGNEFVIDLDYLYNPVDTFLIKEYRYAGFSFRATDYWTKNNTYIFTSERLNRDEANGERARWCVVTGDTPKGKVSIQFMSHPSNYNHPEPMRIWPSNSNNGIGNVYINFNPSGNKDWLLLPGKNYLLQYRILIVNGEISSSDAEKSWKEFTNSVKITIQ